MEQGNEQDQVKKLILLNVKRIVTNLFKSQLELNSELNQIYLGKLIKNKSNISEKVYGELAWWDSSVMGNIRKKTLDKGNDTLREIDQLFEQVDIKLK